MNQRTLSLYELNALVKRSLSACLPATYWVQAELSDVRTNYSGHCYLEFVQKEPHGNNLVAKARGTIWSPVFRLLKPYFEETTGQAFTSGIKVLVQVAVDFHELYGYSLTVKDIDPTYTLGDMALRRREILRRLEAEGVLTLNKELKLPRLARRVAVISSPTAAGYGDFCNQLERNPYGFVFRVRLFPAVMQGERTEASVIAALDAIHACRDDWDVVVIIRGGGATSDLSGFDTYPLAANCAQFPLPIITGIGHERDDTLLDLVAHTRVKTPTAAAEHLINHLRTTAEALEDCVSVLCRALSLRMTAEKKRLSRLTERLPSEVRLRLKDEQHRQQRDIRRLETALRSRLADGRHRIQLTENRLSVACLRRLERETHRLQLHEQQLKAASPERLLRRGYSITLRDGKAVTDAADLKAGDTLVTRFASGEATSIVTHSQTD